MSMVKVVRCGRMRESTSRLNESRNLEIVYRSRLSPAADDWPQGREWSFFAVWREVVAAKLQECACLNLA